MANSTGKTSNLYFPTSAFFYGTLMAPEILHRVCHGGMDSNNPIYSTHQLKTFPAILHDYRRHRVRDADYPAIVPHKGSTVRGTYVTGLTENDIIRLDTFEGYEYRRDLVKPRVLTTVGDAAGKGNVEGEEVEAETYIWQSDLEDLEDAAWDFAEFQREKLSRWASFDAEEEYAGVDEAVAEAKGQDTTGGRWAGGPLGQAVKEEQKKDGM